MDRNWIQNSPRGSSEYMDGLKAFIEVATAYCDSSNRTRCPCCKCLNRYFQALDKVEDHLILYGFDRRYTRWSHHGDLLKPKPTNHDQNFHVASDDHGDDGDEIDDLLHDTFASFDTSQQYPQASSNHPSNMNDGIENHKFYKLLQDEQCELYPGCDKFSKLSFMLKFFHLKTIGGMSNRVADRMFRLFKSALPVGETLPETFNEAKSIMRELGLGYIPIHACKNDCILFRKEHEHLSVCPICGESRYKSGRQKKKNIPQKVMRHFPLIPRLQRLFMSRKTSVDMRWHKDKREAEENVLRHPADSITWQDFDNKYPWFSSDSRNVRLGLASDGFNPFGNMSNSYSVWPVMLMPYNLPPWKCMKDPFMFMSLLIPGPKSLGNDIDIYLQPLVDELKDLWDHGIVTYDASSGQSFKMHAALLWTINDFPAYANLSGWSTKGYLACSNCNKDSSSMGLTHGRKTCYMGHRRFLETNHIWRRRPRQFDGTREDRVRPKSLSGEEVFEQLHNVPDITFGKLSKRKRSESELNWTKKSVFFQLPYWKTLKLRHNLDVMHIEKNICDNIVGTLLNIKSKTKDNPEARLDLQEMGIRDDLHLIPDGDGFLMPPASYILSNEDKMRFCAWLKSVKFPDGFASNIARCVNVNEKTISGLKSHDCHVLLQRLLPVAIRGYLEKELYSTLTELGFFFKELCSRTLRMEDLQRLDNGIPIILCKLERIFPPSFFVVMVHLAVHLPEEAMLAGPVQFRWMYPIERFLHKLKKYVRNRARPEGSIAEAYIDSECLTFCSMYLSGVETKFNQEERNYDGGMEYNELSVFRHSIRPLSSPNNIKIMEKSTREKIQWYILHNCEEIASYLEEHISELQRNGDINVQERHEREFASWFQARMVGLRLQNSPEATDALYSLALGPNSQVRWYTGCICNGIRFHTIEREKHLVTQNSGVVVRGEHQSTEIDFYGVIKNIIELKYIKGFSIYLFECDWWDVGNTRTGIQKDQFFISVNISRKWYKNDQYILASQAEQVFYLKDTKLGGDWYVVQKIQPRNSYDVKEVEEDKDDEDNFENIDAPYQEVECGQSTLVFQEENDENNNENIDSLPLIRRNSNFERIQIDDVQIHHVVDDEELEDETLNYGRDELCSPDDSDIEI